MTIDMLEANALRPIEIGLVEKMKNLNASFETAISAENGFYGVTERIKDNGIIERIGKNEYGHTFKEYIREGQLLKRRENLGQHCVSSTFFDDNGVDYYTIIKKTTDNRATVISEQLKPNAIITKKIGDSSTFTSVTDAYGRPIINKMTDLQLRTIGEARQSLNDIIKDGSYRQNDHRGHIIADSFGGPATRENVVAQLDTVNLNKMKAVEKIVRDLKAEGHSVDYEMKVNYVGAKDARPSSFEPSIIVDGEMYGNLPEGLRKIYNDASESYIRHTVTNIGERFGVAHEMGVKSGLIAAGLSFTFTTVDNMAQFLAGEITADDMVIDIVEDTAAAGAAGYGTVFVSTAISQALSKSSSTLISKVGGSCLPAAVVSFAVESYEDISSFAKGETDASELAYNLGENASGIAGGLAGIAAVGAVIGGAAIPFIGTVAGTIVGGIIGCVIATEIYETAVELGTQGAEIIAQKATQFANVTIEAVKEYVPEKMDTVKEAFNDFFSSTNIPCESV